MSLFHKDLQGRLEKHIKKLEKIEKIPDSWLWWDQKKNKIKYFEDLLEGIIRDFLTFHGDNDSEKIRSLAQELLKDLKLMEEQKKEAIFFNDLIRRLEILLKKEEVSIGKIKKSIVLNFEDLIIKKKVIGLRAVTSNVIKELLSKGKTYPNQLLSRDDHLYFWTVFDNCFKYKLPRFTKKRGSPKNHNAFLRQRTIKWAKDVESAEYFFKKTGIRHNPTFKKIEDKLEKLKNQIKNKDLTLKDLKKIEDGALKRKGFVLGLRLKVRDEYKIIPDEGLSGANYAMQIKASDGIDLKYLTITPLGSIEKKFLEKYL